MYIGMRQFRIPRTKHVIWCKCYLFGTIVSFRHDESELSEVAASQCTFVTYGVRVYLLLENGDGGIRRLALDCSELKMGEYEFGGFYIGCHVSV